MKVPKPEEVAKIIADHKHKTAYLAPVLAKWCVDHLNLGPVAILLKQDRDRVNKAHKAAEALLKQLDQIGPEALHIVLAPFLNMRNPEVSPNPAEYQAPIIALANALSEAGREIDRRRKRPDTNIQGITIALAAWDAWDAGDAEGRRQAMPEGLRDGAPFISFLGDLLGACGLEPEKTVTIYRATLAYLKNHR